MIFLTSVRSYIDPPQASQTLIWPFQTLNQLSQAPKQALTGSNSAFTGLKYALCGFKFAHSNLESDLPGLNLAVEFALSGLRSALNPGLT